MFWRQNICNYWSRPSDVRIVLYLLNIGQVMRRIMWKVHRRHLHYLWNKNMTAWLQDGNDPPQDLNCLTSLSRRTSHIGNETKLSSLSIDGQLTFKITAWQKLGNKALEKVHRQFFHCSEGVFYTMQRDHVVCWLSKSTITDANVVKHLGWQAITWERVFRSLNVKSLI